MNAALSYEFERIGSSKRRKSQFYERLGERVCLSLFGAVPTFRHRLLWSGQIFARMNFVPGPPVYMDPCTLQLMQYAPNQTWWSDEEINLLLYVVIDYKAEKQGNELIKKRSGARTKTQLKCFWNSTLITGVRKLQQRPNPNKLKSIKINF